MLRGSLPETSSNRRVFPRLSADMGGTSGSQAIAVSGHRCFAGSRCRSVFLHFVSHIALLYRDSFQCSQINL